MVHRLPIAVRSKNRSLKRKIVDVVGLPDSGLFPFRKLFRSSPPTNVPSPTPMPTRHGEFGGLDAMSQVQDRSSLMGSHLRRKRNQSLIPLVPQSLCPDMSLKLTHSHLLPEPQRSSWRVLPHARPNEKLFTLLIMVPMANLERTIVHRRTSFESQGHLARWSQVPTSHLRRCCGLSFVGGVNVEPAGTMSVGP